jgi:hypothetical protein
MAVNNIKKINVRSPYYIEVANASEEPVVPDITEPVVPIADLRCGYTTAINGSGLSKWRLNMSGREFGDFVISVTNITIPVKMRVYNEGDTAGAWITKGRDSYAEQWLQATGEDDSELTSRQGTPSQYPAIGHNFTYDYTQSESDTYGDTLIFEFLAPIGAGNILVNPTCQDQVSIASPTITGYVHVLTMEHRANATAVGYTVTVNGTNYDMSANVGAGGGIRLIYDDTTPLIAPQSNDNPYPRTGDIYSYSFLEWDYAQMVLTHLPYSSFNGTSQNIRVQSRGEGRLSLAFRMARRPVADIGGVRTLLPADEGKTAYIHFEHQTNYDISNANINFDSDSLIPTGTFDSFVNGTFDLDIVPYLTNKK